MRHSRVDHVGGQAQPAVELAHLHGVAAGQVVVDRDHVHALAFERVEVDGQGGGQGLALAGAHLGDLAHVLDHAADQLDIEMAHPEHPHRGFTADRSEEQTPELQSVMRISYAVFRLKAIPCKTYTAQCSPTVPVSSVNDFNIQRIPPPVDLTT